MALGKSPRARYWIRHTAMVVGLYAAIVAAMWAMQDRLIFPGAFMQPPDGFDANMYPDQLRGRMMPGPDGEFFALHAVPTAGKPVVIAFHGNGMYPEDFQMIFGDLLAEGAGIVAPAYRGYPRSPGHPSEEGIHADAKAAYAWTKANYPDSPVVVMGHSLGTGPAVRLAAEQDVAGMVLLAPFLSLSSVAKTRFPFLPVETLIASPFRSDLYLPKVRVPVLAVHGRQDVVVPFSSGAALLDLATSRAEFVPLDNVDHVEVVFDPGVSRRIRSFVASLPSGG